MYRGSTPLAGVLKAGGWHQIACPPGQICVNTTSSVTCPAGRYCEVGANFSLPCTTDMLWLPGRRTAEEICLPGSTDDPGRAYFPLVLLVVVVLVPLLLLLEMCACLLKRWAKLRRMPTVSRTLVDGALIDKRMMPEKKLGRGGSFLEQAVSAMTPGRTRRNRDPNRRASHVKQVLSNATADEINYFQALTAAEAQAMPRDEDMRWVMATLAMHPKADNPPNPLFTPRHPAVVEPSRHASRESSATSLGDLLPTASVRGLAFIHISLRALDFHIGKARVLKCLFADASQGQLVALMGESGSGKSTLLNVLGGRSGYGEISVASKGAKDEPHSLASLSDTDPIKHPMLLNSAPFEPRRLKALVGFVPQAHIIFKELTVYENLVYASQMRAESTMTVDTRMRLVEMSLDLLGLQECRHFVCDPSLGERLSGGQLRRIGIGIELVCDPPIMLLDEPTSALDAVNTRLVITALKDLTKRGILVIASLHQPRETVFKMFDKLWLMRKGELAYGGMVTEAIPHFASLGYPLNLGNPADFFIEVCFGMVPGEAGAVPVEEIGEPVEDEGRARSGKGEAARRVGARVAGRETRKKATRRLLRAMFLAELRNRAPGLSILNKGFPGSRIAEVAFAELARIEHEKAFHGVGWADWVDKFWRPKYGGMMSERLRDQLWKRATERAERLRMTRDKSRNAVDKVMSWISIGWSGAFQQRDGPTPPPDGNS